MKNTVLSIIGQRWRELVGFAMLFRALESLIFAPVAAVAGKWLLGRTVLDSTALVSFLLSPRGFLALLFAVVTALTIRLIEHAGLSAIFFGAFEGRRVSSREALRLVGRHLPLLEVRKLAPAVPVGYLLSFNASKPSRLEVEFLSVEQKRLDRAFILQAHRRAQQVYAWTVNTAEDMRRLLDLGVDGVITDQPALPRKTLDEYLRRPKAERAARQVVAWLAN